MLTLRLPIVSCGLNSNLLSKRYRAVPGFATRAWMRQGERLIARWKDFMAASISMNATIPGVTLSAMRVRDFSRLGYTDVLFPEMEAR